MHHVAVTTDTGKPGSRFRVQPAPLGRASKRRTTKSALLDERITTAELRLPGAEALILELTVVVAVGAASPGGCQEVNVPSP